MFLRRRAKLSDLNDLTAAMFLAWLAERMAATSANSVIDRLAAEWRFFNRRRLVNTWPEIQQLRVPERLPLAWLRHEMTALWVACESQTGTIAGVEAAGWWLGLHCCIADSAERIGAVMRLEWSDVDLLGGWMLFRAESRKGRTRDRIHRLHPATVAILRRIKAPARKLVFPWDACPSTVWARYKEVLEQGELPNDRRSMFHRMRRTVASYFAAAGGDPTKLLDHSDPRVTRAYIDQRIVPTPQASDLVWRPGSSSTV